VPLDFISLCYGEPVHEVSTALLLLDSTWVKMLKLEEVVCDQLEVEGHVLAEKVLTCFQSRDPFISLDSVVLGPAVGTEEATSSGVQDAAKIVAT
jgi:hypothetical protein